MPEQYTHNPEDIARRATVPATPMDRSMAALWTFALAGVKALAEEGEMPRPSRDQLIYLVKKATEVQDATPKTAMTSELLPTLMEAFPLVEA